jgi:tetratricopeptide (TPR) repeat protein
MKAWSALTLMAALAVPTAAAAQRKPSGTMQTRSAEVYMKAANETADRAKRQENYDKALEVLTEGAQRDGDNPLIWFMMGEVYARLSDPVGADSAFDKAEALYPDYGEDVAPLRLALWIEEYNAGIAAVNGGDPAGAIARFEEADAIYRGRPDAALMLASLYEQTGDLEKAEAAYRTAIDITRGPEAANVPPDDREQWAQEEATAALNLGHLLTQLGRADDAIATYSALVENQPDNPTAQSALATALSNAGRKDEATAIYQRLLTRNDLSDIEWFNTGVGLYSAGDYDLAIQAFDKSLEVNPYSRDALYNLGQSIYGAASDLEKKREDAPEADKAAMAQQLTELYTRLADTADKLREMDPSQRSPLMMLAQAQRSLGELAADPETKSAWQQKVLATLEAADAMAFEVSSVDMRAEPGQVTVSGVITNLKGTEGQNVTLEFSLVGEGGDVIATQSVAATLPAPDGQTQFDFAVETDKIVLGWRYKVAG